MRGRRTAYAVIFLVAGLATAGVFYVSQPGVEIVRARSDIAPLTQITADMVGTVRVAPADAPADAAHAVGDVVGQYTSVPILAGEDVDPRVLEGTPGQLEFGFGAPLPAGMVAFALPLADPAQAVGAALAPGAKVEVIAVPNALKTGADIGPAASAAPSPAVMGEGITVLALRTADGQPLTDPGTGSAGGANAPLVPPKLGSVVVAIPAAQVPAFAAAALDSTFYLALAPGAP